MPARPAASPAGRGQNTSTRRATPIARAATTAPLALGMTTPPHVPVTGVQCSNCHTNTATSFVTYTMNHASVSAARCDSCHNGSYTGEGTKGALGTASYAGHVATTGRDCITCHASAAAAFTSWAGAVYAHQPSDTNCSSCHNGTTATGKTTPPHIPVTGVQCSNCHTNTAASFVTYTMTHSAVSAAAATPATTVRTRAKAPRARWARRRMPATWRRRDATASPATPARPPPSPAGRAAPMPISRAIPTARAATTARPRPATTTPPHIPMTGVQCSNCHTNTAASFVTYTMNHSAVSGSRCDACHNGSYTARRHQGRAGHGVLSRPRRDRRPRLRHLSRQRGDHLHQLGRRRPMSTRRAIPTARAATTARPRPG